MSKSLRLFYTKTQEEIIEIISNATDLAFLEKGETLIKENVLSEKGKSIETFLNTEPFGCNTENVAKLMSLLLEEKIIFKEDENSAIVPNPQDLALYKYDDDYFYLQDRINEDDENEMIYYLHLNEDKDVENERNSCTLEEFTKPTKEEIVQFVTIVLEELEK